MDRLKGWTKQLRAIFRKETVESELDAEIRFHLEMEAERIAREEGVGAREAQRRAYIAFGGVDRFKEGVRDARWTRRVEDTARDARLAVRALRKSPAFTAAAVLTLALGIGANTAIYTLVDSILLRPLPFRNAERLVTVGHTAPGLELTEAGQSEGTYLHYRTRSRVFEEFGAYYENVVSLTGEGEAERVHVAMATHSLFTALGARPVVGRLFTELDGRDGGAVPVLISHDLWVRRFGSDPGVVGRMIEINKATKEVVGVLEPGFGFPRRDTKIWYPSTPEPATADTRDFYYASVGLLRPGVTPEAAESELNRLVPSLAGAYGDATPEWLANSGLRTVVRPLKSEVVGDIGTALWLLMGGMAMVLLIACANVANLFLVRAEHRRKEVCVRVALGARRGDLARFLLGESLLLALLGGALGTAFAVGAVRALVALGPEELPRLHEIGFSGSGVAFATALSIAAGLFLGAIPLLRHRRPELSTGLREGGRGATAGPLRQRTRSALVATQVALALTLLVGSALMAQSFWQLRSVDPGFDAGGVLTLELPLPHSSYPNHAAASDFWHTLLDRVRALPGVEAAGAASALPLVPLPAYYDDAIAVEGREYAPDEAAPLGTTSFVTRGYFDALRITVAGPRFGAGETPVTGSPVLLSRALATRLFGDEDPIGRRVRRAGSSDSTWLTVVGLVGDVPREHVAGSPADILYVPVLDRPVDRGLLPSQLKLAIRAGVPPTTLTEAVRRIVRDLDPDLPMANVRTMERIVAGSMARTSLTMVLLLVAAMAALALGAIGIYGVVSYTVSQRMHEIGLRLALGAGSRDVVRLMVREGTGVVLAGVGAGLVAALALSRFLESLLFGVHPADPATLASAAVLLFSVALAAMYLPARRAAAADPMVALRAE